MKFALIGHPLAGSGSPALFRRAYEGRWEYDLVDEEDFGTAWRRFLQDYRAVNITAPFKEAAAAAAARLDPSCKEIGAINIAVKTDDGKTVGFNSDYLAIRSILSDCGIGKGSKIVVAGWGGAGKAARAAGVSLGAEVTVCNRTPKPICPDGTLTTLPLESLATLALEADTLVYTLPIPMKGIVSRVIVEANYKTPCLQDCALERYIPGTDWLLEQARLGYPLMTGETPCFDPKR